MKRRNVRYAPRASIGLLLHCSHGACNINVKRHPGVPLCDLLELQRLDAQLVTQGVVPRTDCAERHLEQLAAGERVVR